MRSIPTAFLLAALAASAEAQPTAVGSVATQSVTVELSSFRFTPATITLHHGQPWRLHLVNRSHGQHNFAAPEFFNASTLAPEDRGKVVGGRISLADEQAVDVVVTPNAPGAYPLRCTHFMHTAFGMTGRIVVD